MIWFPCFYSDFFGVSIKFCTADTTSGFKNRNQNKNPDIKDSQVS